MVSANTILLTCNTAKGPLNARNSGVYTCTAYNSVDSDSKSITLLVKSRTNTQIHPEFVQKPLPSHDAAAGQELTITTTVTGGPKPEIVWNRDGQSVTEMDGIVTEEYVNIRGELIASLTFASFQPSVHAG